MVDVVEAMSKYVAAVENYHRLTTPSTWLEALVKTYVGDALAAGQIEYFVPVPDASRLLHGERLGGRNVFEFLHVPEVEAAPSADRHERFAVRCKRDGLEAHHAFVQCRDHFASGQIPDE